MLERTDSQPLQRTGAHPAGLSLSPAVGAGEWGVRRWLAVPAGLCVLLCLGTVYSWSIFLRPVAARYGESVTDALLPFTALLVMYAAAMLPGGRLIDRWGARRTLVFGGALTGAGYIASAFAPSIWVLVLTYGVVAGTGVGMAYGVPLAVVARSFPGRRGLAVGLTVVGFGLSPLITAPLARWLIAGHGLETAFWVLGTAVIVIVTGLSPLLKMPAASGQTTPGGVRELLARRSFWGLWVCYVCGTLVGLGAIGISASVGAELIRLDPGVAAWAVALFAVCNGAGRPLFGWATDRYSPIVTATVAYTLTALACGGMLLAGPGSTGLYLLCFSTLWFCLGGWLAIAPTSTLRLFNPARYASNYGVVFSAYGIGAICGTLLAGRIRDLTGGFDGAFVAFMIALVPGMLSAWLLLRPGRAMQASTSR
jgi:MFS transporter, OFA family, oxalate/formate antiporter